VRGYAQLALRHLRSGDEPDIAAIERWLSDIDAGASRLTQLVSEFMDASLIRAGQNVPLQVEPTDLAKLIADRLEEHRRRTDAHRFVLQAGDGQVRGEWDPSRLARVLDNLLENAIKFMPDGGEIRVHVASDDSTAMVAVEDGGIGIASSDLELVFNPMYRGANAGKVAGTGLGLAGSRRLIQQMGGTIEVSSTLGAGSTFTVRLPLAGSAGASGS
jgi:signal transduction histidine kinase